MSQNNQTTLASVDGVPIVLDGNLYSNFILVAPVSTVIKQDESEPSSSASSTQEPHRHRQPNESRSILFEFTAAQNATGVVYVNPKQYLRILKRREARTKLLEQGRIPTKRCKYLHESRHRHAMKRVRTDTGRFRSNGTEKIKAVEEEQMKA